MKKVLILAYDFPPYVSVGGLRPYNWLKYLPDYGVQPIVVTRNWNNEYGSGLDYITASPSDVVEVNREEKGLVIRTPYHPNLSNRLLLKHGEQKYRLLRKMLTGWNEMAQYLWVTGTKKELYYAAEEYLEENPVDAIIATGDPFILFDFARKLGDKFNIPWIADYRDPWSASLNNNENQKTLDWNRKMEQRIVPSAYCVTTVSDPVKAILESNLPNQTIHILPNGFDPEVMEQSYSIAQGSEELTISLAGSIYGWHPWKIFMQVFERFLINNNAKVRLKFYGVNIASEMQEYVDGQSQILQQAVSFIPRLSNEELIPEMAKDNVLLLFNDYAIHGTKVFDYVGLKRKIILCFSEDAESLDLKTDNYHLDKDFDNGKQLQREMVEATQSGVIVKDQDHLYQTLLDLLKEFKEKGSIACNSVNVERYSRKIQVEQLANLIKTIH